MISTLLKKKLHPQRFKGMSDKMALLVELMLGNPHLQVSSDKFIASVITSDGGVLVSTEEDKGLMNTFIGAFSDLESNFTRFFDTADLTDEEHKEAEELFKKTFHEPITF